MKRKDVAKAFVAHVVEALRWASDQPCQPSNCGTVCLRGTCHARRAITWLDPEYKPKHTKNWKL